MTDSFINHKQSRRQRRVKYNFLKDCGLSSKECNMMRDWTHKHIILYLYSRNDIKTVYKERTEYEKDFFKLIHYLGIKIHGI